ncbi:MAG TPA: hypothetical protein GXZ47_02895 [Treponema sp.]|nr:hypothetical protein [Treponema sp.]
MNQSNPVPYVAISSLFVLCFIALAILMFIPIRSSITLWKDYRVLTVSPPEFEKEVIIGLKAKGLSEIVTESNSMLLPDNTLSPVQPFITEVNNERRRWFSQEKTGERFFFLSDVPDLDRRVTEVLSTLPIIWTLEENGVLFLFPSIILLILLAAGIIIQKNRILLVVSSIPTFILALSWNRPSGMITAMILLSALTVHCDLIFTGNFSLTAVQRLRRLLKNLFVLLPVVLLIPFAFLINVRAGVLLLASLAFSIALIALFHILSAINKPLGFVPMHPKTLYRPNFFNKKLIVILSVTLVICSTTGMIFFAAHTGKLAFSKNQELYLPTPSGYTDQTGFTPEALQAFSTAKPDDSLPDLSDFLAVQWKIAVFPWQDYRNNVNPPQIDEQMLIEEYVFNDEIGMLQATPRVVATFDREFIKRTLAEKSTPLEEMLIQQGQFVSGRITRQAK